jgi:uncharacterized membrane protein
MEQASAPQGGPKRYERGSEEFSRALALSDGVFAIAMTLLVVGIALPSISATRAMSATCSTRSATSARA